MSNLISYSLFDRQLTFVLFLLDNSILSTSYTAYIVQKSTGYLVANSVGAPIYDTIMKSFIKANSSINTEIAKSYNYLISHGYYDDCEVATLYTDISSVVWNMTIALASMKDSTGTNEFQVVYVNLAHTTTLRPSTMPSVVPNAATTWRPTSTNPLFISRESTISSNIQADLNYNLNNRASATSYLLASYSGNITNAPMSTRLLHSSPQIQGDTQQAIYGLKKG